MKILLLGEFSALHKNLKEGLLELGHDVLVAASSDGFKKIPVDINFDPKNFSGLLGKLEHVINPFLKLPLMKGFDVVQSIDPFMVYGKYLPYNLFYDHIINNNEKFFLLAAGDDAYFWQNARQLLKYSPLDDYLKYDLKSTSHFMATDEAYQFNKELVEKSHGVIPIMYEYEMGYLNTVNKMPTIPIPININEIKYKENIVGRKLVVFHGLNRYGFKGTRHVEEAFSILEKRYPKDLELVIDGKMPLDKYLALMSRTNVVVDQMYAHSCGVNAIYALAMGKVVIGGAEQESLNSLGITSSPVRNVEPDANDLIKQIEMLMEEKNNFPQLGYESRCFVEKVHNYINVAEKYIDVWSRA